jgi:hypothetical protein
MATKPKATKKKTSKPAKAIDTQAELKKLAIDRKAIIAREKRLLGLQAKELQGKLGGVMKTVIGMLTPYRKHFTELHVSRITSLVSLAPQAGAAKKGKAKKGPKKAAVKFRIPDGLGDDGKGTAWAGRGEFPPKAVQAWLETPAGRAYRKKNPDEKTFPFHEDYKPAATPVKKAGKKPVTKTAKKASKKTGKKTVAKKSAKKAATKKAPKAPAKK